jgi:hypothetical protein
MPFPCVLACLYHTLALLEGLLLLLMEIPVLVPNMTAFFPSGCPLGGDGSAPANADLSPGDVDFLAAAVETLTLYLVCLTFEPPSMLLGPVYQHS